MPEKLPSIMTFLEKEFEPTSIGAEWTFVQPRVGHEITALHTEDTNLSPKASTMAIRRLRLARYDIVPVHVHDRKEKVYINDSDWSMVVVIFINGAMRRYVLEGRSHRLVVPAGCPHGIMSSCVGGCECVVITSTNDGNDIRWEDNIAELIANKHKKT